MTMEVNETIESLLGPLRAKRNPPEFKPRSRSLHDLPGGIRVPIIKASRQPRLKDKLKETMAGLQELELLREMHQKLVIDAKHSGVCKDSKKLAGPGISFGCFCTSKLSDISEERMSGIEAEEMQDVPVQDTLKYRDSYSPYVKSHSKDTHSLCVTNGSVLRNSSQEPGNTQVEAVFDEEDSYSGSSDAPELNKSVNRKGDGTSKSAEMQMRLRRSSFRCEAVLTHHKTNPRFFQNASAMCNYPSPMHAVLRQFSSVSRENVSDKSRQILKETAIEKETYPLKRVNVSPNITNTSPKNAECNNMKVGNISDDRGNHSGNIAVDTSLHRKTKYNAAENNSENDNNQKENSRCDKTSDRTISKESNKEFIRVDSAWDLTPKQGLNMSRRMSLPASLRPFSTPISSSNVFSASDNDLNLFKKRLNYLSQTSQKDDDKVEINNTCDPRGASEGEGYDEPKKSIEVQNVNVVNCPINLKPHRSFSEVQLRDPATITRLHKTVRQTAV
ncbi:hypothetical protein ACJMK2_041916 [Sinanodonta woodiana]|uniref:Uncharacterized protein n=1 Tax=Sinanodonta woodiana TaxID=1069815 RepID=A0ABD3W6D3_SINWO